jgi:hypothetical protein
MRWSMATPAVLLTAVTLSGCRRDVTAPEPQRFRGCEISSTVALNTVIAGSLRPSDCVESVATYGDYYSLKLTRGVSVTIDLASADFDARLVLYDRVSGQVLAEDDDGGVDTNARPMQFLRTGEYVVIATSYERDNVGAYSLGVR